MIPSYNIRAGDESPVKRHGRYSDIKFDVLEAKREQGAYHIDKLVELGYVIRKAYLFRSISKETQSQLEEYLRGISGRANDNIFPGIEMWGGSGFQCRITASEEALQNCLETFDKYNVEYVELPNAEFNWDLID
ncbi:hypothetical protein ACFL4W_03020 [Planctomycetota bacterium]